MEAEKGDSPKLPDMVMCGDHPSFTKTELNAKLDNELSDLEKEKKNRLPSNARISPKISLMNEGSERTRAISEHALRIIEARRHARSLDVMPRVDDPVPGNRALVQAALGSFRWPPYLVAVWVLVLVLTHVLHCLVAVLERSLPSVRKCCQYFRTWTEESWKAESEHNSRCYPFGLATATALLYVMYYALYALYSVAVWAVEPLLNDDDKRDAETKVINYLDEVNSKTNSSGKP